MSCSPPSWLQAGTHMVGSTGSCTCSSSSTTRQRRPRCSVYCWAPVIGPKLPGVVPKDCFVRPPPAAADRIRALDAGADDVLTVRTAHLELVARLHALARRTAVTRRHAVDSTPPWHRQHWPATMLTPRQAEVLQLVADGLTDQQIAARLRIQPRTARFHVASILFKLGAGNRAHAAVLGAQLGLLAASASVSLPDGNIAPL